MLKITCPIALLIFLLPFCCLKAQETTAEITGLIADDKAPLMGAAIVATHTPTGTQYSTVSRKDGRYNIPNLKIGGPYIVTVSFVGYKEERKDSIMLLIGQDYKVDFILIQQSKELEAVVLQNAQQGKVFNNNHTGPQEIISRVHFESLPAIHRSVSDFTRLIPWAANGSDLGGRNSLFNNTTLDGAGFSNVFGLVSDKRAYIPGLPISIEAIEQIQVNLAPYDVRYGGFAGSNINIVSRSGTNTFKASAYTFLHGSGMTGYKVGDVQLPKASYDYNRVGFLLRGPIIKNKLFYLINAEQENEFALATSFTASDTSNTQGDFVSVARADSLNHLRQFLINRFQYDPGFFQGYNYTTKKKRVIVKIDWNIGTNTTLAFKYNHFGASKDDAVTDNRAPGITRQPSLTGLPFSGTGYTAFNNYHGFGAELNTNWSDKASNKLQAGYILLRNYRKSMGGKDFPFVDIKNGTTGESYTAFGFEPFSYNNFVNIDILQIADILTVYKGSHEITLGTQNFIKLYKSGYAPHYSGYYRFNSLDQFYDNVNGISEKSSYYVQYPATKDGSIPVSQVGINEFSFFVQDKLRLKNKLVLTYGLRLDAPVFHDKFASNPAISSLKFRDGQQYDVSQKPVTNILFSPRLGFNWDVSKNVKTQIRGGAGLFAGPPPLLWLSNTASNNGGQFGTLNLKDTVFSPDIHAYHPSGESISPDTSYELALIPPGFKYPQVLKANIAIDRLLPGDIIASFEAAYVKDIIAVYFQNVNLPSAGLAFGGSDSRVRYPSTSINSETNPTIEKAILMNNSHKGYAYSMTLQLQKRVSNFYFGASYTYSQTKSINDGGSLQTRMWNSRAVTGDPNNDELGYAEFYLPHRILAYGSFRKTYAKYFATSVSFIFQAAPSGVGSYTYDGDMNNDGSAVNNDLIYIPKDQNDIELVPADAADTRTTAQIWAQLDNFIKQDTYLNNHRGKYAERNAVVLPFFKQLDLNISQEFILGNGKHTLKLSFDIINVGNLLNKNWGKYKTFTTGNSFVPMIASFLKYEGYAPDSDRPTFSFPYLDPENEIPLTNSFKDNTDIYSRWQGQIGIRYSF